MSPQIFGEKINSLKSAMDFASAKNRAISSNIANIETPGYKRFKIMLDEKLGKTSGSRLTLERTNAGHIDSSNGSSGKGYSIVRDDDTIQRADGNNVDIDRELADMSANAIYYTSLSGFLAKNFASLRSIISEGRR